MQISLDKTGLKVYMFYNCDLESHTCIFEDFSIFFIVKNWNLWITEERVSKVFLPCTKLSLT